MGIYDRDYNRDDEQGVSIGGWSMVTTLIVINVAIFLIDMLFFDDGGLQPWLSENLELHHGLFIDHWRVWELLTYGFFHLNIAHVGWNMFGLWLWGRDVEDVFGRRGMLWVYLTLVIGSGLVTAIIQNIPGYGGADVFGASGAIFGVTIMSVMYNPRKLLYIWGVFPVPAWALATFYLLSNIWMLIQGQNPDEPQIAVETHLAGAALGYFIYRTGWTLESILPKNLSLKKLQRGPKLRLHQPEPPVNLSERVDEILEKISRQGEASLTKEERRILVDASRRYQRGQTGKP